MRLEGKMLERLPRLTALLAVFALILLPPQLYLAGAQLAPMSQGALPHAQGGGAAARVGDALQARRAGPNYPDLS